MRILAMASGIAGAVALSQFPEYSQQYVQRLSGAVDELRAITLAFDTSAKVAGLSREEALRDLGGTSFGESFSQDLGKQIYRYDRLNADYQVLADAAPLQRLARFYRIRDAELAQRTWDDYQPAVPVTPEGFITAGIGFAIGWGLISTLTELLFGRRRRARYRSFVR